jgi:transcription initiation factor TFIID TATA-box-binding protein
VAKDRILALLSQHSIPTEEYRLDIHNIVIVEQFDRPFILETIIANLDAHKSSYEPEQFPALIYKDWNVNFLLFSSGKVILTGAKSEEQAKAALEKIRDLLDTADS